VSMLGRHLCRYQRRRGWGNGKFTIAPNTAFPTGLSGTPNDNGGVVGATLGANFQTGAFVFGVEGDWDYSGINTGTTATICNFSGTGWPQCAVVQVTHGIASCSMPPLAVPLPMCKRPSMVSPIATTRLAGLRAPVSSGPSHKIGRRKSNTSTSISAVERSTARLRLA
jgi:hypothetical protein